MRITLLATLTLVLSAGLARADDWPQWLGPKRDGVWRETGILEKFPKEPLKPIWSAALGGGFSGPAVANGKVYITDRILPEGVKNPDNRFATNAIPGKERVLCLDAKTGNELWKYEYDCPYKISYPLGPRCTPTVADGKVYTLGAMGDLYCFDAVKGGEPIWHVNFVKDYKAQPPMWGFSSHPLVDGKKVICLVGGKGSVAVAFDKDNGKEIWKSLSLEKAQIGYAPPTMIEAAGKRQLLIWHPESINSLDPETGDVYWTEPYEVNANMTIATPKLQGDKLYLSCFYSGSMLLELGKENGKPAAKVVWKSKTWQGRQGSENPTRTDGLHCVMNTPVLKDGYVYGVCSYGELRCVQLDNDERKWMTLKATGNRTKPDERWGHAFLIPNGDRCFLFNEKGELIIVKLNPEKYEEISRTKLLEPTYFLGGFGNREVVWVHPAFADKCIFVRNDKEIICVSLAADGGK